MLFESNDFFKNNKLEQKRIATCLINLARHLYYYYKIPVPKFLQDDIEINVVQKNSKVKCFDNKIKNISTSSLNLNTDNQTVTKSILTKKNNIHIDLQDNIPNQTILDNVINYF